MKCDREKPCGACDKHNFDCVYNTSPTTPRAIVHHKKRPRSTEDPALSNRLKHYETILHTKRDDTNASTNASNYEQSKYFAPNRSTTADSHDGEITAQAIIKNSVTRAAIEDTNHISRSQVVQNQDRSKFVEKFVYLTYLETHANLFTVLYGPE